MKEAPLSSSKLFFLKRIFPGGKGLHYGERPNLHFSYRFCYELPPSAPCGLLCEQAVSG
jgi:hypothetical protein